MELTFCFGVWELEAIVPGSTPVVASLYNWCCTFGPAIVVLSSMLSRDVHSSIAQGTASSSRSRFFVPSAWLVAAELSLSLQTGPGRVSSHSSKLSQAVSKQLWWSLAFFVLCLEHLCFQCVWKTLVKHCKIPPLKLLMGTSLFLGGSSNIYVCNVSTLGPVQ